LRGARREANQYGKPVGAGHRGILTHLGPQPEHRYGHRNRRRDNSIDLAAKADGVRVFPTLRRRSWQGRERRQCNDLQPITNGVLGKLNCNRSLATGRREPHQRQPL